MRTKHLFYTAAMAALFAACVNDDFETIGQQENAVNDGRPVVGNVELNFTKGGADTRLIYDNGYAWEATDEIGALLMDNVIAEYPETESLTWLEKYKLVNDIHTSYRFTYDVNEKVWGCDAKMLEGNYFFAYPWESYDGERRVKHSLTNQTQEGVGAEIRRESYAKNQFFIGYSQIMAGTNDTEVLDSSVEMVPVLGAIQLQIVNTGTQTYHINKVVLKSDQLYSTLTFDPTNAAYGKNDKWNLEQNRLQGNVGWGTDATATTFNYANYTGNQEDIYYSKATTPAPVYNIAADDKYERNAALRAVVNQDPTETDNYAEIAITGTEEQRALVSTKVDEDAIAYVLIMANAVENVTKNGLKLDIYTDEGIVRNIDLTVKTTDNINNPGGQDKYEALVSSAVKAIGPSVVNTVGVQIDDNSFNVPTSMDIYTNDDLEQFIKWNINETGAQTITAELVKPNVTLSAEMAQLLADNSDVDLTITGNETLTLAEGVVSNLLDLENVHIKCDIKVEGTLNLTEDSELNDIAIAVAEGATLNINEDLDDKAEAEITNEGVVEMAENAKVPAAVTFTNKAEMNIAANADVRGAIENEINAVINSEGYIRTITNNATSNEKDEDAVVNLTGKGTIAEGTNNGIINAGKDSRVTVEGSGEIIIELGATVKTTNNTVAYKTGDLEIDDTTLESLNKNGVEKLILTGDVEITAEKATAKFDIIAAQTGSSLTVSEDAKGLAVTNLNIEGDATTDGAITATTVTVEEDVTLNNYGDITATTFTNNGEVNNHGTVTAQTINGTEGKDGFGYNDPYENDGQFETILKNAVVEFMDNTTAYKTTYKVELGNAETANTFLFFTEGDYWQSNAAVKALKAREEYKNLTQTQLNGAVTAIENDADSKTDLVAALKAATLVTQSTAYETKTGTNAEKAAYAAFKKAVVEKTISIVGTLNVKYSVARAANALSEAEIDDILKAAKPQMYVWKGCPLDEVMQVTNTYTMKQWNTAFPNCGLNVWESVETPINTVDNLMVLIKIANATESNAPAAVRLQDVLKKYPESNTWAYTQEQFDALNK